MASAPPPDGRRAARDLVSFRVAITREDSTSGVALMVDLSPLGFMARTVVPFAAGATVTVRLPEIGAWAARIIWALGGRIGAEFADPIPAPAYARLLASAPFEPAGWDGF